MLVVKGLSVSYRAVPAVVDVALEIGTGEVQVILGANGAGKTTIIKAIMGLVRASAGSILFDGKHELRRLGPFMIHRLGISWVPEARQLWGTLTVLDNMRMGAFIVRDRRQVEQRIAEAFEMFPILKERQGQLASSLSGGEQQMLAIARSLMSGPRLILMDEPSLGLAPIVVNRVFDLVGRIRDMGISVLMVEQNARKALRCADTAYLLEVGRVVDAGPSSEIAAREGVQAVFLGGKA
ncbi:MAG: ABC transporter ATP-binding protein [Burkholderiaceae bacterium]|nr:ABC transporter ATP-binding protein [Burkholderiaceae bacterium]